MATSIWGGDDPLVAWNENSWQSNLSTVILTGVSATTSVGSIDAFNTAGWGSDAWGEDGWDGTFTVVLTSAGAATTAVGSVEVDAEIGEYVVARMGRLQEPETRTERRCDYLSKPRDASRGLVVTRRRTLGERYGRRGARATTRVNRSLNLPRIRAPRLQIRLLLRAHATAHGRG